MKLMLDILKSEYIGKRVKIVSKDHFNDKEGVITHIHEYLKHQFMVKFDDDKKATFGIDEILVGE